MNMKLADQIRHLQELLYLAQLKFDNDEQFETVQGLVSRDIDTLNQNLEKWLKKKMD